MVEQVRILVKGTVLSQAAIASEAGVSVGTIRNWQRREGWVRPPGKRRLPPEAGPVEPVNRPPRLRGAGRGGGSYGSEVVETARRLAEETILTRAEIAARVGVSTGTIGIWARRQGWTRPPGTQRRPASQAGASGGFANPRSRRGRGRRYVPEVVERVRFLVEETGSSVAEIAAKVGIGSATVSVWIRRRGWRRPLGAYRSSHYVAADRAGLAPRLAAAFGRVARLCERERARLQAAGHDDPDGAGSRLAEEAGRWARHHDRAGLPRVGPRRPFDDGRGPVRLSLRPDHPRRHPRPDDLFAQARELVERTVLHLPAIAARLGIATPTLIGWCQAGGWIRPPGAPSRFGGPRPSRRWHAHADARIAARRDLEAAERQLDGLERDGRAELPEIAAAFGALGRVVAGLRRQRALEVGVARVPSPGGRGTG